MREKKNEDDEEEDDDEEEEDDEDDDDDEAGAGRTEGLTTRSNFRGSRRGGPAPAREDRRT